MRPCAILCVFLCPHLSQHKHTPKESVTAETLNERQKRDCVKAATLEASGHVALGEGEGGHTHPHTHTQSYINERYKEVVIDRKSLVALLIDTQRNRKEEQVTADEDLLYED